MPCVTYIGAVSSDSGTERPEVVTTVVPPTCAIVFFGSAQHSTRIDDYLRCDCRGRDDAGKNLTNWIRKPKEGFGNPTRAISPGLLLPLLCEAGSDVAGGVDDHRGRPAHAWL